MSRQLTFRRAKDLDHRNGSHDTRQRQILLSYVRAEAANHALLLKDELLKHGYSVYLVNSVSFVKILSMLVNFRLYIS